MDWKPPEEIEALMKQSKEELANLVVSARRHADELNEQLQFSKQTTREISAELGQQVKRALGAEKQLEWVRGELKNTEKWLEAHRRLLKEISQDDHLDRLLEILDEIEAEQEA